MLQADDLLFCYRWLLLEMKREFAFEDALRMLEVMWSALPPSPPEKELMLYDQEFCGTPPPPSPRPRENAYTKICALRRQTSGASLSLDEGLSQQKKLFKPRPFISLDEAVLEKSQDSVDKSCGRVVKNLNEFLSFDKNSLSRENKSSKKLNLDIGKKQESEDNGSSPDDSNEYFPMTTSMTRELRLEMECLDRQVLENDRPAQARDEVFVWENPLRVTTTPDEQTDLEMDLTIGEIIGSEGVSIKSVTPIKLLKKRDSEAGSSPRAESPVNTNRSSDGNVSLLARRKGTLEDINTSFNISLNGNVPRQTEDTDISNNVKLKGTMLPPPDVFGGGNPFLMFLCITVLRQHRDLIMRNGMDYNEMAMHFDKMVRKHDVNKVLNMARQMYASYLRQHNAHNQTHLSV